MGHGVVLDLDAVTFLDSSGLQVVTSGVRMADADTEADADADAALSAPGRAEPARWPETRSPGRLFTE